MKKGSKLHSDLSKVIWYRPYRALKIGTLEPAKWTAKNTRCDQSCGFIDIISTLVSDPHPNGFTVQILRQNCSESLKVYLLLHLAAKLHQNVPSETESLFSEAQLRITAICKCSKGSTKANHNLALSACGMESSCVPGRQKL